MEKEFLDYPEALELKELGFDSKEFISYVFVDTDNIFFESNGFCPNSSIWAPTFSQAFRWFREEYNFDSYIRPNIVINIPKTYQFNINDNTYDTWYETYLEAELECLKKLIEIVKINQDDHII